MPSDVRMLILRGLLVCRWGNADIQLWLAASNPPCALSAAEHVLSCIAWSGLGTWRQDAAGKP
jgi:hypothetical protein